MFSKLDALKQNVIFLFIGNRELTFVRFVGGKIFSTRSHKVSYDIEQNSIKGFFKDYFVGKEGIPICIVYDIPNQVFTEYTFSKAINTSAIRQAIMRKVGQEISQEAVHEFFKVSASNKKSAENIYQVVSLIKTPIASLCLDLLGKFPNPIAGYFSMLLEMTAVCEGSARRVKLPKAIRVIEQDDLDIKERDVDDICVAVQHSPISGINFALYQGKRILFQNIVSCKKIDETIQSEVNATVTTIIDYCKQLNTEYKAYIYGSEALLKCILQTELDVKSLHYTQADVSDAKFFYHKQYNVNLTKTSTLDVVAFKCLYEPTLFIPNNFFFSAILKHKLTKFSLVVFALFIVAFFIYELFMSSLSVLSSFTKYSNSDPLNISKVLNQVESMEREVNAKKAVVYFYSAFSGNTHRKFYEEFKPLVRGSVYIKSLTYSCRKDCNNSSSVFNVSVSGRTQDLQDYYNLVSDVRRVFFQQNIARKIDENTGEFSLQIETISK